VYVNERFAEMHGYKPEELINREAILLNHPEDREMVKDRIFQVLHGSTEWATGQNRRLNKDGTTIWCQMMVSVIDYKGKPAIMGNVIDITERRKMEEELKSLATHDALTGLPNRRLLYDRFDIALANAQRNKKRLAIVSLDLDKFKAINDTFGHDIGDKLLVAAAGRLTGVLRKVDTVARIGGDEFALLLWDVDLKDGAAKVAQKVVEEFRRPFLIEGHTLHNTVSLGVALYPQDGKDIKELMKKSDESLYRVKESGRDNYQLRDSNYNL
jgi:diguanylate cyclase (GGDEF)-like protein/PAS domain S-box-containing protein